MIRQSEFKYCIAARSIVYKQPKNTHREMLHEAKLNTRLLEAVENDDMVELSRLLDQNVNPNATCNLHNVSACHVAAMKDNDSLFMLIKRGAKRVRRDIYGRTPLHLAIWAGNLRQIGVLLEFSNGTSVVLVFTADASLRPESSDEDLKRAENCNYQYTQTSEENKNLLRKITVGLSPETLEEIKQFCKGKHELVNTPYISYSTVPETWEDSLEHNCHKIDANWPRFEKGLTPLHVASVRAQYSCVQLLLAAGAKPRAHDYVGHTVLDVVGAAYYVGYRIDIDKEIIKVLLAEYNNVYKINKKFNNTNTPLHTAVELGCKDAIVRLLDAGASATCLNSRGLTAMHICVEKRYKDILMILANYEYNDQDANNIAIDAKDKKGETVLYAAMKANWADGVCIALGAGANVLKSENNGQPLIHLAAATANIYILRKIIAAQKYSIDWQNDEGQTALHIAIINNHIDIVKELVDNGASLTAKVPDQGNVLHFAAQHGFEEILTYLLNYDNNITRELINDSSRCMTDTPTARAVSFNHPECLQLILAKRAEFNIYYPIRKYPNSRYETDAMYTEGLHVAVAKNYYNTVKIILEFNKSIIDTYNIEGFLPLHEACRHGSRETIKLLLDKGCDLSEPSLKKKHSSIELLMNNLSKPVDYMEQIFDSCISSQGNLQEKDCEITVNYNILLPKRFDGKQLEVVKALVNTGNRYGQRKLLLHPLVESFLYLKWKALKPFFYAYIVLYMLFVVSLNTYVGTVFFLKDLNSNFPELLNGTVPIADFMRPHFWEHMIYASVSLIVVMEVFLIRIRYRSYFVELETWAKFISIILTLLLPSAVSIMDSGSGSEWARLNASIVLLLCWCEMLILISRFPNWGFYVLMFEKVTMKVLKVLLTFIFLIIGFSLCFMVQFRGQPPFEGPWDALTKTLIMMTSEYDYTSMISNENISTPIIILRLTFIVFVILASIVLMNLMVGVAVNDVNNLEEIGNQKRLEKQVEFLFSLDHLLSNKLEHYVTKIFKSNWSRHVYNNTIVLRPGEASWEKIFPKHINEAIFEKVQQQKRELNNQLDYNDFNTKLNDIHDAIVIQNANELSKFKDEINEKLDKINKQMEEMRQMLLKIKK